MSESDREVLAGILEQCARIRRRIDQFGIDEESFVADDAMFDLLIMPVFQIGELSGALSDEFRTAHREVPWHAMIGFRNIIGHDYGVVDPLWAWNTIQIDIPELEQVIEGWLASE